MFGFENHRVHVQTGIRNCGGRKDKNPYWGSNVAQYQFYSILGEAIRAGGNVWVKRFTSHSI